MFFLQNRWKLQGRTLYYYGLRNRENLLRRRIRHSRQLTIDSGQLTIIYRNAQSMYGRVDDPPAFFAIFVVPLPNA